MSQCLRVSRVCSLYYIRHTIEGVGRRPTARACSSCRRPSLLLHKNLFVAETLCCFRLVQRGVTTSAYCKDHVVQSLLSIAFASFKHFKWVHAALVLIQNAYYILLSCACPSQRYASCTCANCLCMHQLPVNVRHKKISV